MQHKYVDFQQNAFPVKLNNIFLVLNYSLFHFGLLCSSIKTLFLNTKLKITTPTSMYLPV